MPISSVTQVLLRLFALHWFLTGLTQLGSAVASRRHYSFGWDQLAGPLMYMAAGLATWYYAPPLSRLLAKENNVRFSLRGATTRQLYTITFLGLGLYYSLGTLAAVFNWIHFFA